MPHLVLLGDSIFDNAAYTQGRPCVIEQVTRCLPAGWSTTLLAVDGDTAVDVVAQMRRLPPDATHLALSVGGNDALNCMPRLEESAGTVIKALATLAQIQSSFRRDYSALLNNLVTTGLPLLTCTVYDQVPGLAARLRTALSLFNDVILREAIRRGLPVLDLRMICTEPSDYSDDSPIEPSSQGGAKLAERMVAAVTQPDLARPGCRVYP